MPDVLEHSRRYWQYEYDVSARYMVPLLKEWGVDLQQASVLDVGCGEGGGVCGLADAGAQCAGFDIDSHRIGVANALMGDRAIPFVSGNMYEPTIPFAGTEFDLVVLHDVFEHLEDKQAMLRKLNSYMKPGGKLLITFPPYFSAFGAHQQHLRSPFLRLPFAHLVPFALSRILPRLKGEDPTVTREIEKLDRLRMGIRSFERIARASGLSIVRKQAYLVSPNHIRFGLRPLRAGFLASVPLVAEVFCSGVAYLLSRE